MTRTEAAAGSEVRLLPLVLPESETAAEPAEPPEGEGRGSCIWLLREEEHAEGAAEADGSGFAPPPSHCSEGTAELRGFGGVSAGRALVLRPSRSPSRLSTRFRWLPSATLLSSDM